jgi:hypothetical protein
MSYSSQIVRSLEVMGISPLDFDTRHIEAIMRLEHPTLDHLDREAFGDEVRIAVEHIEAYGPGIFETVARSMGL